MRLQLALITTFFSSAIFALAIGKDIGSEESIVSREFLEKSFDNKEIYQKRDFELDDPAKELPAILMNINRELKGFTHENNIYYDQFEKKKDIIELLIPWNEKLVKQYIKEVNFTEEMKIIRRYYNALRDSSYTRKRFEGHEILGSDWVEEVMDANVKAMSLYFLKALEESQKPGYYRIFTAAKSKIESIEANDKTKLSPAMRNLLNKQIEQAKESLEMLEKLSPPTPPPPYSNKPVDDGFFWRQRNG